MHSAMEMKSYQIAEYKMPLVVAEQPRPVPKGTEVLLAVCACA